jgi:hypothetical protein
LLLTALFHRSFFIINSSFDQSSELTSCFTSACSLKESAFLF